MLALHAHALLERRRLSSMDTAAMRTCALGVVTTATKCDVGTTKAQQGVGHLGEARDMSEMMVTKPTG